MVAADPDLYFYPDQYNNPANAHAHYEGTGPEILRQTEGRVTHFVAGLGTCGTFTGVGRRLREHDPLIPLIGVQPDSPLHALEGLKHLASTRHVPGLHDPALPTEVIEITSEEAQATAFALAEGERLQVGPSAAAAAAAARKVAERLPAGVVVTVFPDSAVKYAGEPFYRGFPRAAGLPPAGPSGGR
jgi:cysteine synthase B